MSIEYEVSWPVTAPAIHSVKADIGVGNLSTGDLAHIIEVMYAPGMWGMGLTMVNDRFGCNLDIMLRTVLSPVYNMDMHLIYEGKIRNFSCEMNLTLV